MQLSATSYSNYSQSLQCQVYDLIIFPLVSYQQYVKQSIILCGSIGIFTLVSLYIPCLPCKSPTYPPRGLNLREPLNCIKLCRMISMFLLILIQNKEALSGAKGPERAWNISILDLMAASEIPRWCFLVFECAVSLISYLPPMGALKAIIKLYG